jgi:glycosidase
MSELRQKLPLRRARREPSWLADAVFYQVYPQSFLDSNRDGIGDLNGITAKLDYIRSLGCTAMWLNPFFESPFRDAGYDVTDFCRVAPRYGTLADFRRLVREAHRRGLRVCLDLVPGHTSNEHPWFVDSSARTPGKYKDWYVWTDNIWGRLPPGVATVAGMAGREGQYVPNFFSFQPALNYGFAKPDPDFP